MSKPAARVGDMHTCPMVTPGMPPVPHVGGPILPPGAPTVFIAGQPAAKVGDMCTCVGPPDSIVMGSLTVTIGGIAAARMGDMTMHGGVISVGCPTVLIGDVGSGGGGSLQALTMRAARKVGAPFTKMACDRKAAGLPEPPPPPKGGVPAVVPPSAPKPADAKLFDAGAVKIDNFGAGALGGGTHKMDILHASADAKAESGGVGGGVRAEAEARLVRQSAGAFVGDDPNNPFAEATAQYEIGSAEAKGDLLIGEDERRTGIVVKGSAAARVLTGEVSGERNIPIPFTDWSIAIRAKASGDLAGAGVGGGAHAYLDRQEKRLHVGASGKVSALIGAGVDFDISIGRKYQSRDRGTN